MSGGLVSGRLPGLIGVALFGRVALKLLSSHEPPPRLPHFITHTQRFPQWCRFRFSGCDSLGAPAPPAARHPPRRHPRRVLCPPEPPRRGLTAGEGPVASRASGAAPRGVDHRRPPEDVAAARHAGHEPRPQRVGRVAAEQEERLRRVQERHGARSGAGPGARVGVGGVREVVRAVDGQPRFRAPGLPRGRDACPHLRRDARQAEERLEPLRGLRLRHRRQVRLAEDVL